MKAPDKRELGPPDKCTKKLFSYFSRKTYFVSNPMSTQNICFSKKTITILGHTYMYLSLPHPTYLFPIGQSKNEHKTSQNSE